MFFINQGDKMKACIRLFKAIPIPSSKSKSTASVPKKLLKETIPYGFIFTPNVYNTYSKQKLLSITSDVHNALTLTETQTNSSFHKSWNKIKNTDLETLAIEQLVHYITTYGFERLGIYSSDTIYIPKEKLKVPNLQNELPLLVIKGLTKKELKEKLILLLSSGIALKAETISDAVEVGEYVGIEEKDIALIKNKEAAIHFYAKFGLVPHNPVEFLRYIVYLATKTTLLIKNKETINIIKAHKPERVEKCFFKYESSYSFIPLARIFLRFKPLFLAFRYTDELRSITNRLRKMANRYHQPMEKDFLNSVTEKMSKKKIGRFYFKALETELSKVNIFRKIRLANALQFRINPSAYILYKIRSGKGWVEGFNKNTNVQANSRIVLTKVLDNIAASISPKVKGKRILIPSFINYTLPATEKQFVGYFPDGTYIDVASDAVIGVYWENVQGKRVDLDLSLISSDGEKYGWNANWRSENADILFSGDMTDATNGASELYYIQRNDPNTFSVWLNDFTCNNTRNVPYKLFIAREKITNMKKNYVVDPNNVLLTVPSVIDNPQKTLGVVDISSSKFRFYFSETNLGKSISSSNTEFAEGARDYMVNKFQNNILLKDILKQAGATVISKGKADIDLSPEKLEKDSIINLLT